MSERKCGVNKVKCIMIIYAIGFIILISQLIMISYELNKISTQVEENCSRLDKIANDIELIDQELDKLEQRIEIIEEDVDTCKEYMSEQKAKDESVIFYAGDKILMWGSEENNIGSNLLKEFKVESIYPIVAYKVISHNGEVLQDSYFEAETQNDEANYTFRFEGLTDEVTKIWLTAYDSDGLWWVSRGYNVKVNN